MIPLLSPNPQPQRSRWTPPSTEINECLPLLFCPLSVLNPFKLYRDVAVCCLLCYIQRHVQSSMLITWLISFTTEFVFWNGKLATRNRSIPFRSLQNNKFPDSNNKSPDRGTVSFMKISFARAEASTFNYMPTVIAASIAFVCVKV